MKEHLLELARGQKDLRVRLGILREYIQALVLESLQRASAMLTLAFHGGTALRFLFGMRRYSEDLDFSLEHPERASYDLRSYMEAIRSDLQPMGFEVRLTLNTRRPVHRAFVRIPGLLHQAGLSPHPAEVLAVKIEVDTNPPAGAGLATTLVRRHVLLHLQHHDKPSLLAGKLHAVLARPAVKGRDLYDLAWYLGDPDWPEPNLAMLRAALAQTGWTGPQPDPDTWVGIVGSRLAQIDFEAAKADVRPFVESQAELAALTREGLLARLQGRNRHRRR